MVYLLTSDLNESFLIIFNFLLFETNDFHKYQQKNNFGGMGVTCIYTHKVKSQI